MTGAMYAAISGMKTHMNKLNVIGNNVANVNTIGYKSARTTFKESIYTSMRNGSNGSNTTGGMNPAQIGYGCNIGTIDLDMSTQTYMPTGVGLDCMISGSGFFFVGPKPEVGADGVMANTDPKSLNLTRVGNFTFDSQGYLVDGYGSVIYGFVTCAADDTGAVSTTPGTNNADNPAYSTQLVPIRMPLAAKGSGTIGDDDYVAPGSPIYPGINNRMNDYDLGGNDGLSTGKTVICNTDSIRIDETTGQITATVDATKGKIVVGYIPLASVSNPNGVTHLQGPYYAAGPGAGDCTVASIGNAASGKFLNNGADATQGAPLLGTGETKLITNGLEASGTDISTEFSEMISTQRGYQANTRIITVTDAMLEELVNIKR